MFRSVPLLFLANFCYPERIDLPTLIVHGDDDQLVPIDASARRSAELVKDATLKVYPGAPHGLVRVAPHKDQFNADLLVFLGEGRADVVTAGRAGG
jgi:pimeloyl-ACP methyl ester carboxylesterase